MILYMNIRDKRRLTPLAGDPACSRRVSVAKSQRIGLDRNVRKGQMPGRDVELSSRVFGGDVQGQSRRAPKAPVSRQT